MTNTSARIEASRRGFLPVRQGRGPAATFSLDFGDERAVRFQNFSQSPQPGLVPVVLIEDPEGEYRGVDTIDVVAHRDLFVLMLSLSQIHIERISFRVERAT